MIVAESLFIDCVDEAGHVDAARFAQVCSDHPALMRELSELRDLFECGQGLVAREPSLSPVVLKRLKQSGRDLKRLELVAEVGRGGMGLVRKAFDPDLRRYVAVKTLQRRPNGSLVDELVANRALLRMLEEAQVAGQLQHPGIVPIFELGIDAADGLYFTMPLVDGERFERVIAAAHDGHDSRRLARALTTLLKVCETVAYAHSRGVLHRDLKPQNIMVGAFGEAYVMDWGLAKVMRSPRRDGEPLAQVTSDRRDLAATEPNSPMATLAGEVLGTPAYMAPEQAQGREDLVDERSDVYSVGAILYHLLSGYPPYCRRGSETNDHRAILVRVLSEAPARVDVAAAHVPAELAAICHKAMQRNPAARYQTMVELKDDVANHLEGRVVRAHRTGAWVELKKWIARHTVVVSLLALLFVLVAASAVTFAVLYQKSERRRIAATVAQADSLRRMSALRPMAPWSESTPTFQDDFEDGSIDRRWVARGRSDLVSEQHGCLRLEAAPADEETVVVLDPYVGVIRGDFEVSLDFSLHGFSVPTTPLAERIAYLAVDLNDKDKTVIHLGRHAEFRSRVTGDVTQSYRTLDGRRWVAGDDVRGKLKLKRSGDRITASYWQDGWCELETTRCSTAPATVRIGCRNWYVKEPFTFAIDNLRIETRGTSIPAKPLVQFQDTFEDGAIDSRLMVGANAGVVAELDGRLYFEKIEGRTGSVGIELTQSTWQLVGDFAVSLDFDLMEFPERGATRFLLQAWAIGQGGLMGTIELSHAAEGLCYRATDSVATKVAMADSPRGKLRIERQHEQIAFQYWRDGWRDLHVRPHTAAGPNMFFRIAVESGAAAACVVAIDNLDVVSLGRVQAAPTQAPSTAESSISARKIFEIHGREALDGLGIVSEVGDVTLDGVPDFAVGANHTGLDAGRVCVYAGRDFTMLACWEGQADETFGNSIAAAGDVDADGVPDVIVGAPSYGHAPSNQGAPVLEYAKIFSGAALANERVPPVLRVLTNGSLHDAYGLDVAGLGDVDGDGFADVFVGAREFNRMAGAALVYSGRDGSLLYQKDGDAERDGLGSDGAGLGDLDGDGYADFAIGAAWSDHVAKVDSGTAFALCGGTKQRIGRDCHPPLQGYARGDAFGVSLASLGDVSGDGVRDFAVGACGQLDRGSTPGYVRVISGRDGTTLWIGLGDAVGDYFGRMVAGTGDIDGDGVPDVMAAGIGNDRDGDDSGMVRWFSGKDGSVLLTLRGAETGAYFGGTISALGDIDQDGAPEVLIGAGASSPRGLRGAGSVFVYSIRR
ncbi:MAG: protein kinase [Planctomycetota bacterium]